MDNEETKVVEITQDNKVNEYTLEDFRKEWETKMKSLDDQLTTIKGKVLALSVQEKEEEPKNEEVKLRY